MPQPSSTTRIRSVPPCPSATSMRVAPASTEFSSSSLTTLAGRSITSPAAILLTTLGGSWRIAGIRDRPWKVSFVTCHLSWGHLSSQFFTCVKRQLPSDFASPSLLGTIFAAALVFLELAVQGPRPDAQHFRCFFTIAARELQRFFDRPAFNVVHRPPN